MSRQPSERSTACHHQYDRKRGTPSHQPNVIARLMGIDAIPIKDAEETSNLMQSPPATTASTDSSRRCSAPLKCSLLSHRSRPGDSSRRCLKKMGVLGRSRSRQRHRPQEHLLQKNKEDFQFWQAPKVGNPTARSNLDGRCIQILAQENLRKEKTARYGYGSNKKTNNNAVGADQSLRSPARIVLLKPGSDILLRDAAAGERELMFGLPKVKRDDKMEEFLQQVKDRLQKQLQLKKSANELIRTMATTEIQPVQTAAADLGKRLLSRSAAFRSERKICTSTECLLENGLSVGGTDIFPQRKLVRSFSAPESGISRTDSLLLDSRNHGASESAAMTSRATSSSFRETVSSLRRRFSFRDMLLFGRRKKEPSFDEMCPQLAISSRSPSESFNGPYSFPQTNFLSDSNGGLPELSPDRPTELQSPISESSFRTDFTAESETACNQADKAYIRQVLVAAGLYDDGSLDNRANARVDSMARPICDSIFDEVEDIYCYRDKSADHDIGLYNSSGGNATDHRMLFDLANEALQILVQGTKTGSSLGQWVIDSTGVSRGWKLVDEVWKQVQALRYPQMQEMQTTDSMVAFQVRRSVWADMLYEDVYVVGRKIERAIFDELLVQLFLESEPSR